MPKDAQLVAAKQKYEVYFIAHRYNISAKLVRSIMKQVGRSRKKIYAKLYEEGFSVVNKN